jgi:hypothetical protein
MVDSKKYDGSQWEHSLRKLTTATEAIENPLYTDGTAITSYTISGNTVQNGTPTPTNPVSVQGVGEFDSGQYKIPISSGGTTTNIYLGSTQSVRKIKKLVFTGQENWLKWQSTTIYYMPMSGYMLAEGNITQICTHYQPYEQTSVSSTVPDGYCTFRSINDSNTRILISDSNCANVNEFKAYLTAQYIAGAPVTVWYVLTTPETATVNEPLMKIGDYADTLSNATAIPTTEGANSITVDTTVQPSEFTATWTGWHDANVKEWNGSDWQ